LLHFDLAGSIIGESNNRYAFDKSRQGFFRYMNGNKRVNQRGVGKEFSPRFRGDSDECKRGTPEGQRPYGIRASLRGETMAKVTVDAETCVGCGLCEQNCPDVFEMKDDGIAYIKVNECASCDLEETASQCPVEAIKVE